MPEFFLGIHEYGAGHDAGVAVIDHKGEPRIILEAERFTKIKKYTNWVPGALLEEVFKTIDPAHIKGMGIGQMGQVFPQEPIHEAKSLDDAAFVHMARVREGMFSTPFRIAALLPNLMKVTQFRHHLAHIYSAFCPSPFENALILSVDGNGEYPDGVVVGIGSPEGCRMIWTAGPKASLGTIYRVIGALYCGLSGSEGEGKAMALAAYGKPLYKERLKQVLMAIDQETMSFELRQSCDIRLTREGDPELMAVMEDTFGPRRPMLNYPPDRMVEPFYADMAASLQALVEEYMLELVAKWVEKTGLRNICLAGGVAMNSALNGAILRSRVVDDVFVQPAASDNGLALGAAYGALYNERPFWRKQNSHFELRHTNYGTEASDAEIEAALKVFGLPVKKVSQPSIIAAQKLAGKEIVGWFQGRMEYGARALGNRSILSLATDISNRDNINIKVKNREMWRPFAPATLKEDMGTYFEFDRHEPFMTTVYKVRPEWREDLAAVTHVDGTARVQSVSAEDNPKYYDIIKEVKRLTGIGVILNTSLNGKRYPIVRTPAEAIALFLNSEMDCLVMEEYYLEREDKIKRTDYENDALSILHELSGGEPYVAEILTSRSSLEHEISESVHRAVTRTGGRFMGNGSAGGGYKQKIYVTLGPYEDVIDGIIEKAFREYRSEEFASIKCIEFLEKKKQIRFTGFSEISWPFMHDGNLIKARETSGIVVSKKYVFEKVSYTASKNIVLWPCGGLTKSILKGETPLIEFNGNISICVDAEKKEIVASIPTITAERFKGKIASGKIDIDSVDIFITSSTYLEEIFFMANSFLRNDQIYYINDNFDIFKLVDSQ